MVESAEALGRSDLSIAMMRYVALVVSVLCCRASCCSVVLLVVTVAMEKTETSVYTAPAQRLYSEQERAKRMLVLATTRPTEGEESGDGLAQV